MHRSRTIALIAAAACLAAPVPAFGRTEVVTFPQDDRIHLRILPGLGGPPPDVAHPEATNRMTLTSTRSGAIIIRDPGESMRLIGTCRRVTANHARCLPRRGKRFTSVTVNLRGFNDRLDARRLHARVHLLAIGGRGNDVILAGPGNDTVYGNEGADQLTGGPGRDTLYGDETPDTESPEADHGPGDPDLIDARDGAPDAAVDCGRGIDRALADPVDLLASTCEER